MVTTHYRMMESDPCEEVRTPIGGTQKVVSGKMNFFRKSSGSSIGKSGSMPSAIPLESSTSDEFRDEPPSLKSDDKNIGNSRTPSNISPWEEVPFDGDFNLSGEGVDQFDFNPFWNFENRDETDQLFGMFEAQLELLESHSETRSASISSKKSIYESQPNRPIILIRPAAFKLGQWSKVLVRTKNPFKYQSFTNEKRISRSRYKNKKAKSPFFEPVVDDDMNDIAQLDFHPENFPSLQSIHMDELSTLDTDVPVTNDLLHPNVPDESQCREGASIGPLLQKTTLRLAVKDDPKESEERDRPPSDIPLLESSSKEHRDISSSEVGGAGDTNHNNEEKINIRDKQSKQNENKSNKDNAEVDKSEGAVSYKSPDYPSDGDYSTVFSGKTENLPLLRAWGMNAIECYKCRGKKARKKIDAKKKREAKKKVIDELWKRKHFYWKYESIDDKGKCHLKELDTLVFKIAPETDDTKEDGFVELPLGIQLSTITEGDEDFTVGISPRSSWSMGKNSFGAGYLQEDGKVNTPLNSLLDSTNKDAVVSRSEDEDEVKPKISNIETAKSFKDEDEVEVKPIGSNIENVISFKENSLEPEQAKRTPRISAHSPRGVLTVNEIEVPHSFEDDSTLGSKGVMSDITDDYLHIPFSSPLYTKVMKAFREAATANSGDETEEMNYLRHVVI